MEAAKAENVAFQLEGFTQLPVVRQLGLMFGLAASVALGVAVVLWSQQPNYGVLYSSLSSQDASAIMENLQQHNIEFKMDEVSGAIMVPSSKVHEVRLMLASAGLPNSAGVGFDVLQKKQEFGTSQFMEQARFNRALEGELAQSIATINAVQSARVHLALPKQSVFVRKRQEPSASVLVHMFPGRALEQEQVDAITHMVASSIPNLLPSHVTVIDQKGQLLSGKERDPQMAASNDQFQYTRKLEQNYVSRIESLLTPVVGMDGVRAQVHADLDFTQTEKTSESYDPKKEAIRSEQTSEEQNRGAGVQGVPGALSNQPPGAATAPEVATGGAAGAGGTPSRSSKQSTVNYELDRTISHTKLASGEIKRLSVAVVVDDRWVTDAEGNRTQQPRSPEEIDRITSLVKEAVGYNAERGDTINVINTAFTAPDTAEPLPEPPLWKQVWVWDLARQLGGALVVLLLILVVLRPMMRNLSTVRAQAALGHEGAGGEGEMGEDRLTLSGEGGGEGGGHHLPAPQQQQYEESLNAARQLAQQDPKHVAQVVKTWISEEGA